jgi:hypothetical protein
MQKLAAQTARVDAATEKGAFTLHVRAEERDKKGKVTSTTDEVQHVRHENGLTRLEVVRASKDGKDVTATEREQVARQQEKRKKDKNEGRLDIPFASNQQKRYQFTLLGPAGAPHQVKIGFAPTVEPTPMVYKGEAVVDTDAGALVSMKLSPAKLPRHADRVEISLEYAQPNNLLSKMVVDGEGSFLFIHKHMIVTTGFSEYH